MKGCLFSVFIIICAIFIIICAIAPPDRNISQKSVDENGFGYDEYGFKYYDGGWYEGRKVGSKWTYRNKGETRYKSAGEWLQIRKNSDRGGK